MTPRPPPIAIGLGCRSGVPGDAVVHIVRAALDRLGLDPAMLAHGAGLLCTSVEKQSEPGLVEAAVGLGLPLVLLPKSALAAVSDAVETRSDRVVALFGLPGIAETAALAGAGPGARLVLPRIAEAGVTCAIATARADFAERAMLGGKP